MSIVRLLPIALLLIGCGGAAEQGQCVFKCEGNGGFDNGCISQKDRSSCESYVAKRCSNRPTVRWEYMEGCTTCDGDCKPTWY